MRTHWIALVLALGMAPGALAQETPTDRTDDFGDRLALRIEEFVESLTREFEGRTRPPRSTRDLADDTTEGDFR